MCGRFLEVCGQRLRGAKCFCFQVVVFFRGGGGKHDAFWAPSVSACRPLPLSSLEGRLACRAMARQSLNAEVGHCVPPPRNDSLGDPRPASRGHLSIPSPGRPLACSTETTFTAIGQSGMSGNCLSSYWLAHWSSIDNILFEIEADYLFCINVLFFILLREDSL